MFRLYVAAALACAIALTGTMPAAADVSPEWGAEATDPGESPTQPVDDDEDVFVASGILDRWNDFDFTTLNTGDILVPVNGGFTATNPGHAGVWNKARYVTQYSRCILSANKSPSWNVLYETGRKYRGYDRCYGLRVAVPNPRNRYYARDFCVNQLGEPYVLGSAKYDLSTWYCSKLAWAAYYYNLNERHDDHDKNIDATRGPWVFPRDIVFDNDTWCVHYND